MNTSFTPGPWAISPETDGTEIVAFDANPWSIRQFIARPERGNNWIANARLIAAAPDIYAALVAALMSLDARSEDSNLDVVRQKARAAIARVQA